METAPVSGAGNGPVDGLWSRPEPWVPGSGDAVAGGGEKNRTQPATGAKRKQRGGRGRGSRKRRQRERAMARSTEEEGYIASADMADVITNVHDDGEDTRAMREKTASKNLDMARISAPQIPDGEDALLRVAWPVTARDGIVALGRRGPISVRQNYPTTESVQPYCDDAAADADPSRATNAGMADGREEPWSRAPVRSALRAAKSAPETAGIRRTRRRRPDWSTPRWKTKHDRRQGEEARRLACELASRWSHARARGAHGSAAAFAALGRRVQAGYEDRAGHHYHGLELRAGSPKILLAPPVAIVSRPSTDDAVYDSDGRWLVEAVAMGDNSLVLLTGVPHASAQATAPIESFHPVRWDADIFTGVTDGAITMETYPIPGSRAEEVWEETPECFVPARRGASRQDNRVARSEVVAGHVLGFLQRYPGVAIRTSGIGARDPLEWPPGVRRLWSGHPRRTSATHSCVKAAIVNAVFALRGESAADAVQQVIDDDSRVYRCFKPLGAVLQKAGEARTLCRAVRDASIQRAIQAADRWESFRLLAAKRSGVFIVRLHEVKRVDHAVVVDANNGIIIDSEESTALVLAIEVLERCGGDGTQNLRMAEVRQIKGRE